jgi:hypothetical protein
VDSLEDTKITKLKNGSEIRLNEDPLSIVKVSNGEVVASLKLQFPSSGYGGGSIYVSPSEKYILFLFYSGQSEEAFTLLTNNDEISILYESGYLFGEAASYCFSEREGYLVQGLPYTCSEWWLPWIDGDVERDEEGYLYFPFGQINILNIQNSNLEKHEIIIQPKSNWQPNQEGYNPFLSPEIIGNDILKVSWPWGNENFKLPITGDIVIKLAG